MKSIVSRQIIPNRMQPSPVVSSKLFGQFGQQKLPIKVPTRRMTSVSYLVASDQPIGSCINYRNQLCLIAYEAIK